MTDNVTWRSVRLYFDRTGGVMSVIDPINRVPSWCNKLAEDERLKREAEKVFSRAVVTAHDRCLRVRLWQGVAGVLAVAVVTLAIMLIARSAS